MLTLISVITVEVGINVKGVQKLQNLYITAINEEWRVEKIKETTVGWRQPTVASLEKI